MKTIVALHGAKGSGTYTIAELLKDGTNFEIASFMDPAARELQTILGAASFYPLSFGRSRPEAALSPFYVEHGEYRRFLIAVKHIGLYDPVSIETHIEAYGEYAEFATPGRLQAAAVLRMEEGCVIVPDLCTMTQLDALRRLAFNTDRRLLVVCVKRKGYEEPVQAIPASLFGLTVVNPEGKAYEAAEEIRRHIHQEIENEH